MITWFEFVGSLCVGALIYAGITYQPETKPSKPKEACVEKYAAKRERIYSFCKTAADHHNTFDQCLIDLGYEKLLECIP